MADSWLSWSCSSKTSPVFVGSLAVGKLSIGELSFGVGPDGCLWLSTLKFVGALVGGRLSGSEDAVEGGVNESGDKKNSPEERLFDKTVGLV